MPSVYVLKCATMNIDILATTLLSNFIIIIIIISLFECPTRLSKMMKMVGECGSLNGKLVLLLLLLFFYINS